MSTIGFTASGTVLNFDVATHESSQDLLVSVHNTLYPINEYVLHQVFDPYGYVEKIDILQSSELLQAIVRFDLCQNAVWAKKQLQGRYIYDRCCQLDVQFYKKIDYGDKTENVLVENEFALDLEFIRNKLHEMMVIIERTQDRMKARNSSNLFDNTAAVTPPSTATIAAPPVTSLIPHPLQFQPPKDDLKTTSQPSDPNSLELLNLKTTVTYVDSGPGREYVGIIAHKWPLFSLKHWSSIVEQLDESCEKRKTAGDDARNMLVKMQRLRCESKVLVFDPGGTFNLENLFDLEDKVVFKGSVMIRSNLNIIVAGVVQH